MLLKAIVSLFLVLRSDAIRIRNSSPINPIASSKLAKNDLANKNEASNEKGKGGFFGKLRRFQTGIVELIPKLKNANKIRQKKDKLGLSKLSYSEFQMLDKAW